jgi:PhnB protein
MQLSPYLFFTTNCEPALAFYETCGLGKIVSILRHGDNDMPVHTPSMRGKIMHAEFSGPGVHFFASDNDDAEPMKGAALLLEFSDPAQTHALFKQMSAGGAIRVPFGLQVWNAHFGNMTDRFGVQWMFNCPAA